MPTGDRCQSIVSLIGIHLMNTSGSTSDITVHVWTVIAGTSRGRVEGMSCMEGCPSSPPHVLSGTADSHPTISAVYIWYLWIYGQLHHRSFPWGSQSVFLSHSAALILLTRVEWTRIWKHILPAEINYITHCASWNYLYYILYPLKLTILHNMPLK